MPYTQPFYINGPSLSSSTAVFDDAALTICSADGFYSDGVVTRQQVNCVLLPEQICEACCSDMCSAWTTTAILGSVTIQYDSCVTQTTETVTFVSPFDETLCVMYGTIPIIVSGRGSLVKSQNCGCCAEQCNTYQANFTGGIGDTLVVSYIDCLGVQQTLNTTANQSICCKINTSPQIVSGPGFINFVSCGCFA
jgi:hypothetical protein